MSVKTKSPAVAEMHAQGAAVRALMGGTKAMRAAGRKYLPQWPQESEEAPIKFYKEGSVEKLNINEND